MSLYEQCATSTENYYSARLLKWLQWVDKTLLELAQKTPAESEKARLQQAASDIRGAQESIKGTFSQRFSQTTAAFFQQGQSDSNPYDQQVEQWKTSLYEEKGRSPLLAEVARIVNESNVRVSQSLWELNMRLAFMRGGAKFPDEGNPFAAGQLCQNLYLLLQPLNLDDKIKVLVFKLYEKQFLNQLDGVLDKLNSSLMQSGIFKHLRYDLIEAIRSMKLSETHADGRSLTPLTALDWQEMQLGENLKAALLESKRQLSEPEFMSSLGVTFEGISANGGSGSDTFSDMEMVFALTSTTAAVSIADVRLFKVYKSIADQQQVLLKQLQKLSRGGAKNRLRSADALTIEVLGRWFNGILNDEAIPADLRYIFSYVYIPFVKAAILDRHFFTQTGSSARRLLMLMLELAEHWSFSGGKDKNVYPKLCSISNRLLSEFVDDVKVVEDLYYDLQEFAQNTAKRSALTLKRSLDAKKGGERLELATLVAQSKFCQLLDGKKIPVAVRAYIERPCTDFLSFAFIRYGEESKEWSSAAEVIESAIYSLLQAGTKAKQATFLKHRETALSMLANELKSAGHEADSADKLVESVRQAQDIIMAAGLATEEEMQNQPPAVASASEPALFKEYFGQWFAFEKEITVSTVDGDETHQVSEQLQLIWVSTVNNKGFFVSRLGLSTEFLPATEFQSRMDANEIEHLAAPNDAALLRLLK